MWVSDGDLVDIEGVSLKVMYMFGYMDDFFCFFMDDWVFMGDMLLICGIGCIDF